MKTEDRVEIAGPPSARGKAATLSERWCVLAVLDAAIIATGREGTLSRQLRLAV